MSYDSQNVFAKILRGEIPAKKLYEDEYVIAFPDIAPKAKVHILVIPKGAYITMDEFAAKGSDAELAAFMRALAKLTEDTGIAKTGYRLIANNGVHGGQEVPHFHMHLIGGEPLPSFL